MANLLGCFIGFLVAPGLAQDLLSPEAPATPEACAALNIDVERLACYDTAFQRRSDDPSVADEQASRAKQLKQAATVQDQDQRSNLTRRERVQRGVSDLFRAENGPDPLQASIANAGKGGLLDSRWELARDSKLGIWREPDRLRPSINPDRTGHPAAGVVLTATTAGGGMMPSFALR